MARPQPRTAAGGEDLATQYRPPLNAVTHLITAGLLEPDAPVSVWVETSGPWNLGTGDRVHADPTCEVLTLDDTPAVARTHTAADIPTLLTGTEPLCGCVFAPKNLTEDTDETGEDTNIATGEREAFFVATTADLRLLSWLRTTSPHHRYASLDPADVNDPVAQVAVLGAQVAEDLPRSAHHGLNQLVASRRTDLIAEREQLRATTVYREAWETIMIAGVNTWAAGRQFEWPGATAATTLQLIADLPTGVDEKTPVETIRHLGRTSTAEILGRADALVVEALELAEATADLAARVNPARIWVVATRDSTLNARTVWPWLEDPDDIAFVAGGAPLVKIPVAVLFALPASACRPVCLDDSYTAQMVLTAEDLADHAAQVPELVKAVKAATAP